KAQRTLLFCDCTLEFKPRFLGGRRIIKKKKEVQVLLASCYVPGGLGGNLPRHFLTGEDRIDLLALSLAGAECVLVAIDLLRSFAGICLGAEHGPSDGLLGILHGFFARAELSDRSNVCLDFFYEIFRPELLGADGCLCQVTVVRDLVGELPSLAADLVRGPVTTEGGLGVLDFLEGCFTLFPQGINVIADGLLLVEGSGLLVRLF